MGSVDEQALMAQVKQGAAGQYLQVCKHLAYDEPPCRNGSSVAVGVRLRRQWCHSCVHTV
eukprot:6361327-Pyramimonas_sp.AAC.1